MERMKVLLVGDNALSLAGMKRTLEYIKDVDMIGETTEVVNAVKLAKTTHPDVAIIDIDAIGLDLACKMREYCMVIALSNSITSSGCFLVAVRASTNLARTMSNRQMSAIFKKIVQNEYA